MNKFKIIINLDDKDDFFSKYNNTKLSPSLADYIVGETIGKPFKSSFELVIKHSFELSIEEMSMLKKILINSFYSDIKDFNLNLNSERLKQFILFLIGIAFIALNYFARLYNIVLSEVISIASWVFIWEVIYDICFVNSEQKNKYKRLKQLAKSDVIFEKIEN